MTRDEIAALSNTDLVRAVAEQVMGWRDISGAYMTRTDIGAGWTGWYRESHCATTKQWRPLADWNHAMAVVEAMQAKGCPFQMRDDDGTLVEVRFDESYVDCEPQGFQRAILEAALLAVQSKDGGA